MKLTILRISFLLILVLSVLTSFSQAEIPERKGWWKFDNPQNLTVAENGFGTSLLLTGTQIAVNGPQNENGAVQIGIGSYYKLTHGITANGGGIKVNEYSMQFDFKIAENGYWKCFYQTSVTNSNDGDFFINPSGNIGVAAVGYNSVTLNPGEWYRLVISVKNGSWFNVYLDGKLVTQGNIQDVDGRFSLDNQVLIFADEDGEDGNIQCAELAIWDRALNGEQAASLGGYNHSAVKSDCLVPYLQSPGKNHMNISWHDTLPAETSVVLGTSSGLIDKQVTGTSELISDLYYWHTVKLDSLQPGMRYFYQVKSGGKTSPAYSFKTLPDDDYNSKLRFIVLSDTHNGDTIVSGRIIRKARETAIKLYGADIENHITGIIHSGDIVMSGTSADQYSKLFFSPMKSLSGNLPTLVVAGNHEVESPFLYQYLKEEEISALPGTPGVVEKIIQVKTGNTLFIGLNTNVSDEYGNLMTAWLNNRLREVENDNTVDFVFLFFHHPPMSELWDYVNTSDVSSAFVRNSILPVVKKYSKVQATYSGHTHGYERGAIQSTTPDGDFRIICGGGSGGYLDPWAPGENVDIDDITKTISNFEFQILEIDIADKSYQNTVYSLGTLTKPLDAVVIDSFYKKLNQSGPTKPEIEKVEPGNKKIIVHTSDFKGTDSIMSVQMQVFADEFYSTVVFDTVKHKENIYGVDKNGNPVDLNKDQNIYQTSIAEDLFTAGRNYYFRTRYRDNNLKWSEWSDLYTGLVTAMNDQTDNRSDFLQQNFPNPFTNETTIRYNLKSGSEVHFRIYNTANTLVYEKNEGFRNAGEHNLVFSNKDLPEGLYFYEITTGTARLSKPMVIMQNR